MYFALKKLKVCFKIVNFTDTIFFHSHQSCFYLSIYLSIYQSRYSGQLDGLLKIYREEGLRALWNGTKEFKISQYRKTEIQFIFGFYKSSGSGHILVDTATKVESWKVSKVWLQKRLNEIENIAAGVI